MWISKHKWEALNKRVEMLDEAMRAITKSSHYSPIESGYFVPPQTRDTYDREFPENYWTLPAVIEALIDGVGLKTRAGVPKKICTGNDGE